MFTMEFTLFYTLYTEIIRRNKYIVVIVFLKWYSHLRSIRKITRTELKTNTVFTEKLTPQIMSLPLWRWMRYKRHLIVVPGGHSRDHQTRFTPRRTVTNFHDTQTRVHVKRPTPQTLSQSHQWLEVILINDGTFRWPRPIEDLRRTTHVHRRERGSQRRLLSFVSDKSITQEKV